MSANSSNPMVVPGADMNASMRSYPRSTEPNTPGLSAPQQRNSPGFTIHPPGIMSSSNEFNYEPQDDNSWKVYPPGVQAPPNAYQASMPQAATSPDLIRMQHELNQVIGGSGV
jgi:hypothetical protein